MVDFLLAYGTGEGQTAKVASRIDETLRERGHGLTTQNVEEISDDGVSGFDAVLVGTSIHRGKHQSSVRDFVRRHREELSKRPTAFFQVSLSSATQEGRAQAATYVDEFIEKTGWHPDRIGLFGGALRYSKYGFLTRLMMKQITKRTMSGLPEPDDAGDVEFTDWHEVEAFAADVAAFVEGRLGIAPGDDRS